MRASLAMQIFDRRLEVWYNLGFGIKCSVALFLLASFEFLLASFEVVDFGLGGLVNDARSRKTSIRDHQS